MFVNLLGLISRYRGITFASILKEIHMFTIPYPSIPEVQAYAIRANHLRSRAVATLVRDLVRWVSAAAR